MKKLEDIRSALIPLNKFLQKEGKANIFLCEMNEANDKDVFLYGFALNVAAVQSM